MVETITTETCHCCSSKFQAEHKNKVRQLGTERYRIVVRESMFVGGALIGAKLAYNSRPEGRATLGTGLSMLVTGFFVGCAGELIGNTVGRMVDRFADKHMQSFVYVCEDCMDHATMVVAKP